MISRTKENFTDNLKKLSPGGQKAWALSVFAESILFYREFSRENEFGNPDLLGDILNYLQFEQISAEQTENFRNALENPEFLPDTDNFSTISASVALNVCLMADTLLSFWENENFDFLADFFTYRTEIAEMQEAGDTDPNLRETAWQAAVWAKTELKTFLLRQSDTLKNFA